MAENKKAWYVLRAISGKEAKVKEVLDAAIRNSDLGKHVFQVLIPTEKVMTMRNGKKVIKERNLYSGYVFIEAILIPDVIYELRNTTNVIDFLNTKKTFTYELTDTDGKSKSQKLVVPMPEPLRDAEVARMLGAADMLSDMSEDGINDYLVGETVKVLQEPFVGFTGEIEEVDREKKKLKVMVKIFGRKTPLELENSQVERV